MEVRAGRPEYLGGRLLRYLPPFVVCLPIQPTGAASLAHVFAAADVVAPGRFGQLVDLGTRMLTLIISSSGWSRCSP